ncbi:hypothetical protein CVT24_003667 [Panaeolus cyanescens]|uniref:F-box domain-containing protein n=1 Tax=Panaeolus cyanescens TaxID=181874 RepID=A0A409W8G7_9AGAR|nr:hypothetical protein CVT24_003667 [Panaeolus cyanescens]
MPVSPSPSLRQIAFEGFCNKLKVAQTLTRLPSDIYPRRKTITDLPAELITIIFIYFVNPSCSDDRDSSDDRISVLTPHPLSRPTLLSHICHSWRIIAIQTAILWSSICIKGTYNITAISTWLTRSKTKPLSLHISNLSPTSPHSSLMHLLYTHISRWRNVSFSLPTPSLTTHLLNTIIPTMDVSPAPHLQVLDLPTLTWDLTNIFDLATLIHLTRFPHRTIRRFSFTQTLTAFLQNMDIMPPTPLPRPSFIWDTLHELILGETHIIAVRSHLSFCSSLRCLTIRSLAIPPDLNTIPNTPITVPHLHTLHLGPMTTNINLLFDALTITAPNLTSLILYEITDVNITGAELGNRLHLFIESTGCHLQTLYIGRMCETFTQRDIEELIRTPVLLDISNFSLLQMSSNFKLPSGMPFPADPKADPNLDHNLQGRGGRVMQTSESGQVIWNLTDRTHQALLQRLVFFPHRTLRRFLFGQRPGVNINVARIQNHPRISTSIWDTVHNLIITQAEIEVVRSHLLFCTNLTSLTIQSLGIPADLTNIRNRSIIVPNLRTLNLGPMSANFDSVFDALSITAPNLKTLIAYEVIDTAITGATLGNRLQLFIEDTQCQLNTLYIGRMGQNFTQGHIEELMRTPVLHDIPNFSICVVEEACQPRKRYLEFLKTRLLQLGMNVNLDSVYATRDMERGVCYLGWGVLDHASYFGHESHDAYPFIINAPKHAQS